MPKSENVYAAIAVINTIDNAVSANNDLTNGWIVQFRNDATHLRKIGEALGAADEKPTESDCIFL
jgi:hypothetical protein